MRKNIFDNNKISKLHHVIWVGPKPFSERHQEFLKYRTELFPDWKLKLWTDADVKHLKLVNRELYDKVPNYGQKADILRLELLYMFGGMCADVDFEFLKNFEHLLEGQRFVTGRQNKGRRLAIGAGLIATVPQNPLVMDMLEAIPGRMNHSNIVRQTGPGLIGQHCNGRKDILVLPKNVIYPDINESQTREEIMAQYPEAVAAHHSDRTWG